MIETNGTFAKTLAQYEAAKADVQANLMPDLNDTNAAIYDDLQDAFDTKVMICHQAAIAVAKTPAASLQELIVKVRIMAEEELDLTPRREGVAYVEILADLEAMS